MTAARAAAAALSALALAALLTAAAGCGVPIDNEAQTIDVTDLPEGLRPGFTPTTTSAAPVPLTVPTTVYLLTNPPDTERTVAVATTRQVARSGALRDVLAALFGETTTAEEQAEGYFNTLELFAMNDVTVSDSVATVDISPLSMEDLPPPADTLELVAAQLVFTVAEWGAEGTRILLDGAEVPIPTSDDDADPGSVLTVSAYEQFHLELPSAATTLTKTTLAATTTAPDATPTTRVPSSSIPSQPAPG